MWIIPKCGFSNKKKKNFSELNKGIESLEQNQIFKPQYL